MTACSCVCSLSVPHSRAFPSRRLRQGPVELVCAVVPPCHVGGGETKLRCVVGGGGTKLAWRLLRFVRIFAGQSRIQFRCLLAKEEKV